MTQQSPVPRSALGEGDTYWTGFPNTIRLSGDDTGGAFAVIEMRVPAGYDGSPHVHHREHQTDHVVEGELVFTIGDETVVAEAGTIVHCPKDVPHAFKNKSDSQAIAYSWVHPAGFEEFMARAAPQLTDPSEPPPLDLDRVMELAPDYGLEFLGPDPEDASALSTPD